MLIADDLEHVWKALANTVRREILDQLREGPLATGELVLFFPDISRFAVMQHLKVLEEAGLVVTKKEGRVKINHLNAVPIRMIYERWVSRYEGEWASALTGLKRSIEDDRRDKKRRRPFPKQDGERLKLQEEVCSDE